MFLFNSCDSFVCCHQNLDSSAVLEDPRELHTQRIHCGSFLADFPTFWAQSVPDLEVSATPQAGNSCQNKEPAGSWLGLDLPSAPFLSYPCPSEPCRGSPQIQLLCCAFSRVTGTAWFVFLLFKGLLQLGCHLQTASHGPSQLLQALSCPARLPSRTNIPF